MDVNSLIPQKEVVRRTNKFFYFKDGTKMHRDEWALLLKNTREENRKLSIITMKEYEGYTHEIAISLKNLEDLQSKVYELEMEAQMKIDELNTPTNWEEMFRKESSDHDQTKKRITSIARKVYADFESLACLKNYITPENGIKFIIQSDEEENYRLRFDPYQIGPNYHSSLSEFFSNLDGSYYTNNGGWFKIIEDKVILYQHSSDYGSYDEPIAMSLAAKMFPDHKIFSHVNMSWDKIKHLYQELPF